MSLLKKGLSPIPIGSKPDTYWAVHWWGKRTKNRFFDRAFPEITLFLAIRGTLSLSIRQKPGFFSSFFYCFWGGIMLYFLPTDLLHCEPKHKPLITLSITSAHRRTMDF